jgi:hypothetical protein
MFRRFVLALLVTSCAATATAQRSPETPPEAPKPEHLTSRHRLMVSGAIGGYWSSDRSASYGSYPDWAVYARPSLAYFVRDRIGVGVSISGGTSRHDGLLEVTRPRYRFWCIHVVRPAAKQAREHLLRAARGLLRAVDRPFPHRARRASPGEQRVGAQGAVFQQPLVAGYFGPDRRRFLRFALSIPVVFHVSDNVGLALGPDLWFDVMLRGERYTRTQVGASTTIYVCF